MSAISVRIDPGVRPAVFAAVYLTIAELGLFESAAIFGAFPTYVARFVVMTAACFVAFAYLRQPVPSLRNLTVVPYLIRSLLFATTTVLLILAFSTSPSLNHTYTICPRREYKEGREDLTDSPCRRSIHGVIPAKAGIQYTAAVAVTREGNANSRHTGSRLSPG